MADVLRVFIIHMVAFTIIGAMIYAAAKDSDDEQ